MFYIVSEKYWCLIFKVYGCLTKLYNLTNLFCKKKSDSFLQQLFYKFIFVRKYLTIFYSLNIYATKARNNIYIDVYSSFLYELLLKIVK